MGTSLKFVDPARPCQSRLGFHARTYGGELREGVFHLDGFTVGLVHGHAVTCSAKRPAIRSISRPRTLLPGALVTWVTPLRGLRPNWE